MDKQPLTKLVRQQLQLVERSSRLCSALPLYGGHVLRQTLIVLAAGQSLEEHIDTGETTVQVLHGRVRLATNDGSSNGSPGDLLPAPHTWHSLEALVASAVLVTVAVRPTKG